MDDKIVKAYEELLDNGISIIDLYIYHCIINDDYGYGYRDETVEDKFNRIRENYSNDYQCRDLEYHIHAVLDGEEEEEEWD